MCVPGRGGNSPVREGPPPRDAWGQTPPPATPSTPANALHPAHCFLRGTPPPAAESTTAPEPTPETTKRPATRKPTPKPTKTKKPPSNCDPSYPTLCIPPGSPDLNCDDITQRRFPVRQPDPHDFDRDRNGVGCESD